jgi:hypothetical protein
MWAAGAALLVCLALGGTPVVGQDKTEMRTALVTGTEHCGDLEPIPGAHVTCDQRLSDPRVTGMGYVTFLGEAPVGLELSWGTFTLKGPDGDWVGPWTGVWDLGLEKAVFLITTEGTDAYEGWAFVGTWLDAMDGQLAQVSSVIYRGRAPWMGMPEPTAD